MFTWVKRREGITILKGEELILIIGMTHFDSILVTHTRIIQTLLLSSFHLAQRRASSIFSLFLKPTTFAGVQILAESSSFLALFRVFFFTFFLQIEASLKEVFFQIQKDTTYLWSLHIMSSFVSSECLFNLYSVWVPSQISWFSVAIFRIVDIPMAL